MHSDNSISLEKTEKIVVFVFSILFFLAVASITAGLWIGIGLGAALIGLGIMLLVVLPFLIMTILEEYDDYGSRRTAIVDSLKSNDWH